MNITVMDATLDETLDSLLEMEAELRTEARTAATDLNIEYGNAASALARARREIQAAQYFITKDR